MFIAQFKSLWVPNIQDNGSKWVNDRINSENNSNG